MERRRRDEQCKGPDDVAREGEAAPNGPGVDSRQGEPQSLTGTELYRFDRSRRRFLQLTGLSLGGLMLPALFGKDAAAQCVPESVRTDRALAWALQDVAVKVVTHVPATGATAIFDACHELAGTVPSYSFNEEVAFTMAYGAAITGVRSATLIKSHGLAKAANSVIDSLTLGTTAGFVAVVLDDPSGGHSDNIFGLEDFLRGTGLPFKKAGRDTAYRDLVECFAWSEELRTPVALLVDSEMVSKKRPVNVRLSDLPE